MCKRRTFVESGTQILKFFVRASIARTFFADVVGFKSLHAPNGTQHAALDFCALVSQGQAHENPSNAFITVRVYRRGSTAELHESTDRPDYAAALSHKIESAAAWREQLPNKLTTSQICPSQIK